MSTSTTIEKPGAGITTDWNPRPSWFTTQDADCTLHYLQFGNVITITFLSNSQIWKEGDVVFTVPSEFKPYSVGINFIGAINRGKDVITLKLKNNNGICEVWYEPSPSLTSATRIYGTVTYITED